VFGADQISSVTQLEMLNGANAALVGNEIVQFRDAVEVREGVFEFTGLLRGRRGTDLEVDTHVSGETFLLLTTSTVEALGISLDDIGVSRSYRAVTFGSLFEEAVQVSESFSGNDLKPWAPVHLDANREVNNDLTLTWVRRTRLGGGLRDGTGVVPLGEDSEEYELEILDGPGGNTVRTVTGLTSPTYTYTEADQIADGETGPSLYFKVWQVSAVIGRGFGREDSFTVGSISGTTTTTTS
jgi:hypothetical protein